MLIWLGSFCLLYFFYLREFESALEYQARPVVQMLDESPCQWCLLTHGGERYALSLHYLGAAVLIWNLKGRWQQIIILRPMLSSDDWRQLQVLLRWPTS